MTSPSIHETAFSMLKIKVKTASGTVSFSYTISTPTSPNARAIDPSLPTVLFLHPVYIGHVIFHPQFANPSVRRFNLIGLDMRAHGDTVGSVPRNFRREHIAEDVFEFMKALRLPPCHLFGLSMGACVALQTAVSHPDRVLSLFMLSPLPLIEPEDVATGRQEIYDLWADSLRHPDHEESLVDAIFGSLQLGFNGERSPIVSALIQYILPHAMQRSSPEELEAFHTLTVKFFIDRKPHPRNMLQKIKCPIYLVHCGSDIAYEMKYVEELRDTLQGADLNVRVADIEGAPHFGCVTHPDQINTLFHDWVLENTNTTVPPSKPAVVSPFLNDLVKAGYFPDDDTDEEFFN